MILFFGPAGSGKSLQGQILAARQGWRWLSAGQLLRDTKDPEIISMMQTGELVDSEKIESIISDSLRSAGDIQKVILDGFPRTLDQARWLVESQPLHGRSINLVFVLDISEEEVVKRLKLRGRADDSDDAIAERIKHFYEQINPMISYLENNGIKVVHVDGSGLVGQIHDRIMEEIVKCNLS